ncbi:hypothetical protein MmiAt1_11590 [Methanimicrococcus sp. At1]|uniref:TIGR00304 family protein n=1 Tax=Methanimicrococcus hacksteinii TaxID=3028293 RepID=A0ABU3VQ80_9EURY|nr:DUF131 domain-containing protein [Methanimicrococcus sp. At1]MDV0445574.1 hypothetical protein [Methanimicrococcus sp. At1]
MADINVYFFWPGLIYSIIISIVLSILLTIGLNFWAKNRKHNPESDFQFYDSEPNRFEKESENGADNFGGEPRSKTGGMILIGPIPIVFGDGGFRFDKSIFKYALTFFLIVLILWFIMSRIVRL